MMLAATDETRIPPLVLNRIKVPENSLEFSAACFEGKDWSLAPLQQPEDVGKHSVFAFKVGVALHGLGVKNAYAPSPVKFNAQIIAPERLNRRLSLVRTVNLYRNQDAPADGTYLRHSGDAGVFSAGGCAMLVVACRDKLVFAHAGRECVLDRTRIETDGAGRSRPHESVVDSIMLSLGMNGDKNGARDVYAWPMYSIKPGEFAHHFDDEKHALYNNAAAVMIPRDYPGTCEVDEQAIYIDLPKIMRAQFLDWGVPEENIFLEHAYLSDELPHTRNGGGRYLVATVRH